jgi:DNA-binding LytR/AlgR family response regulator
MVAMRRTQEGSYFLQLRCGEKLAVSGRYAAAVKEALCADAGRPNAR